MQGRRNAVLVMSGETKKFVFRCYLEFSTAEKHACSTYF